MIELKGLEDWARGILATSKTELNRRFGTWKRSDEFSKSIGALPFFTRYRPVFRQISEPTLRELHQKLRGQPCEEWIWIPLIGGLDHPLPNEIALDLVEREVAISWIGHSPQSEEVLWKLAPLVDEALLTIAKRIYTDSNRNVRELQDVLRNFPSHGWMLDSLSHCAASSLEKRVVLERAIETHPKREWLLNTNPRVETDQTPFVYFDWSCLSREALFGELYGRYNAQKMLDIARDDQTPDEILHELEELRGFPDAAKVRAAARHNLRRREQARLVE